MITCDICGEGCEENDGDISIKVNSGGRDIGPATIHGTLYFTQPYGVSDGLICERCKVKWLTRYLEGIE